MITNKTTSKAVLYKALCFAVMGALIFFITQGNSMIVTDLFADKVMELVDSETPAPAEERSDSGGNNMNEELHQDAALFNFTPDCFTEINFHFENSSLYSVMKQRVLTPPPELS